jgi:hypothetical protein
MFSVCRIHSGPRLPSSWNYGAVEKALRESASRGERCIFLPKHGQVFQTLEEAYEYFNMYSWEVGFGIRYGRSRVNAANLKSRQDLVCSCEVWIGYIIVPLFLYSISLLRFFVCFVFSVVSFTFAQTND